MKVLLIIGAILTVLVIGPPILFEAIWDASERARKEAAERNGDNELT